MARSQLARTQKSSFGRESLVLLDPDAVALDSLDPQDSDIAKLLSNAWQCQAYHLAFGSRLRGTGGGLWLAFPGLSWKIDEHRALKSSGRRS